MWIKYGRRFLLTNTKPSLTRRFQVLADGDSKSRVPQRPCEDAFFVADAGDYCAIGEKIQHTL